MSLIYLIIKWFYLIFIAFIKIIFSILFLIIKGFKEGSAYDSNLFEDIIGSILKNIFMAMYKFFVSINDVYMSFWNFASEHHILTIILIIILTYIYYLILNLINS